MTKHTCFNTLIYFEDPELFHCFKHGDDICNNDMILGRDCDKLDDMTKFEFGLIPDSVSQNLVNNYFPLHILGV